ncbi:MAG TPA: acyl-[acyl-carrier-protein]--UDP-N-acetylglucosamine O-acyltransferase [Holosporales bacterium]|nr:acyl-[acyl-carrier-protein]--UDP-N-acetylglucosamine O-acyltransferase [Holosporales bacterium]
MPHIHQTAIIHPDAKIGKGVRIGPYCIIGPKVTLKDNVYLHSHVVIEDVNCTIGDGTELYPFVSINKTQDLKYKGEDSKIIIGKNNTIREYATIQPGTAGDKMRTVIGDNCLLMACTHVAHDCILGNNILMANHATLAGHVNVEDYVIIGGLAAVHQFVTIGAHAIIGGMSGVGHDVIPYANVKGDRANLSGLNLVGLKRRGFNRDQIAQLRSAYDALFAVDDRPLTERISALQDEGIQDEGVQQILDFVTRDNMRSLLTPKA